MERGRPDLFVFAVGVVYGVGQSWGIRAVGPSLTGERHGVLNQNGIDGGGGQRLVALPEQDKGSRSMPAPENQNRRGGGYVSDNRIDLIIE